MPIELDCSEGYEFDAAFREQLPSLGKTMLEHGLDPSAFTFTKGPNNSYRPYKGVGVYCDYIVDAGEESFTVNYANDAAFLEYFVHACVSPEENVNSKTHDSLLGRLARWVRPSR
jgi:hypothetical protein